jgi:hypothetical protein
MNRSCKTFGGKQDPAQAAPEPPPASSVFEPAPSPEDRPAALSRDQRSRIGGGSLLTGRLPYGLGVNS